MLAMFAEINFSVVIPVFSKSAAKNISDAIAIVTVASLVEMVFIFSEFILCLLRSGGMASLTIF